MELKLTRTEEKSKRIFEVSGKEESGRWSGVVHRQGGVPERRFRWDAGTGESLETFATRNTLQRRLADPAARIAAGRTGFEACATGAACNLNLLKKAVTNRPRPERVR
jgi:hypothetical protein